jgi:hypothetical protein
MDQVVAQALTLCSRIYETDRREVADILPGRAMVLPQALTA